MPGVDVGGHSLHVEDSGDGTPVLLLHGFTGSSETMTSTARALQARHRTLRVDLPGHGHSDAPDDPDAYTMASCAEQLARVLDALGIPTAHLLGYSMGGRLALGMAVLRPERVRSLVLVGASAGIADPAARAERVRADEALADEILDGGLETFVERWMALPLFATQRGRLGAEAWEAARKQRLRNRPRGLARSLRGCGSGAQPALHGRLHEVAAPALVAAGADDAKFLVIAEELIAGLPRAERCVVPEAGHACHLENPSAFADAVLSFLNRREHEEKRK